MRLSQIGVGLSPRFFDHLVDCYPVGIVGEAARKPVDERGPGLVLLFQEIYLGP
jgi:hypothetical protein